MKFMCGNTDTFQVTESHSSPVSPPPFMVGMVELELDKATGQVELIDYKAVVDCGTPISILLWPGCRPRAASYRGSAWRFLKTFSIQGRER